jgi:DNA-binding phage protein
VAELEELQEYVQAQNKIITDLEGLEGKSFETKKQYIVRLAEVTRPLVESGYYEGVKLADMASFIHKELLSKHNITYHADGEYYGLFKDDEKHSEKNPMSGRSRDKISSSLPIEKQTGNDVIDSLKQAARSGERLPQAYLPHMILEKIIDMSNEQTKQAESLIRKTGAAFYFTEKFDKEFPDKRELERELKNTAGKKTKDLEELYTYYRVCESTIQSIEEELSDHKMLESLKETLATQKFISKQIDERSKITFLEKWNSIVAEIEIGISAIAKKLGVNKKHLTNNVRPKENPVTHSKNMHHYHIDWFKAIEVTSPSGEKFTFDAKEYFDKQLERGKLNIPFEPLILKNCDVD